MNYIYIIIGFLSAFILTGVAIPQILEVSRKKQLFDYTDSRKSHQGTIPRLGGLAFLPGIFLSLGFVFGVYSYLNPSFTIYPSLLSTLTLILCSLIFLYAVGVADDLVGVKCRIKLIAQFFCGATIVAGGNTIHNLYGLFGVYELPQPIAVTFTILIVILIMNAINLIDGIDGLASSLSGITVLIYGIFFLLRDACFYAVIAFATLGVIIPFFYYNLWGKEEENRKIFMGDTGSLTLGFILSLLLIGGNVHTCLDPLESKYSFVLFCSLLIVPVFDVISVTISRLCAGKKIFTPDNNHIHHKFLKLGFTHRQTLQAILFIALFFFIVNLLLISLVNINLLFFINVLAWVMIYLQLILRIRGYIR